MLYINVCMGVTHFFCILIILWMCARPEKSPLIMVILTDEMFGLILFSNLLCHNSIGLIAARLLVMDSLLIPV